MMKAPVLALCRTCVSHVAASGMTIMIETLLWLVGYQLAGELISRTFSLPLPGPVLGMLLLFATLALRKSVPESMKLNVPRFLSHLSLLFIPAGAAVLAYRDCWPVLAGS
jgi:holin-like protein